MDKYKEDTLQRRIEKTITNLKKNNMQAFFCKSKDDALELVRTMINEGDTISHGGSVTLKETGIFDEVRSGKYNFLDRSREGITPQEVEKVYRDTYSADFYLTSTNAITETGELYNVDGNGNRVSAMIYGPKNVIVVAGFNKIVRTIEDAIIRVKNTAAPPNTMRLDKNTPCSKTGECISLKNAESEMCDGCASDGRICCSYVVTAYQRQAGRIKVIIVGEELGY